MLHYKRLHWFPFCPSDWISMCSVQSLSVMAQGCLIRLMCIQWLEGSIPAALDEIVKLLGGYSGPGLGEALALFVPLPADGSRLRYMALEAARQEAILTHRKRSKAGKKGALAANAKKNALLPSQRAPSYN